VKPSLARALHERSPLLLDGGQATELERQGYELTTRLWSAELLNRDPAALRRVHGAFIDAGADVIASAGYQASHEGFLARGFTDSQAERLLLRAVELVREALAERGATVSATRLVAASMGPWGAAQADGSEYRGAYGVDAATLRDFHRRRLQVLDRAGADLIACETFPDRAECEVLGELLGFADTPAWVSFQCADDRHVADGTPVREMAAMFAEHPKVLAVGVNCVAPGLVEPLLRECRAGAPHKLLLAYPNSGDRWDPDRRRWIADSDGDDWETWAEGWLTQGAHWIGGCCRVGPETIARLRQLLDRRGA
jgi:homocysteine S-methyltransferase